MYIKYKDKAEQASERRHKLLKERDKRLSGLSFGISTGFRKMHKIRHIVVRLPDGLNSSSIWFGLDLK